MATTPPKSYAEKRQAYQDPRVAGAYDARRFQTPLQRLKHRRDLRLVAEILRDLPAGARVLDLPSGTGRLIGGLVAAGFAVLGADLSAAMMGAGDAGLAPADGSGRLLGRVRADAERLPLADGAVDALVSLRFLFHVDRAEARRAVLAEMARVATRRVVIQERWRRSPKHVLRRLRGRLGLRAGGRDAPGLEALERELDAAGLRLERAVPVSRLFSDKLLLVASPARR